MKRAWKRCGAALAVLLGAPTAQAEDTDDLEALLSESIVTTASTTAQTAASAPATSTVITAEELQMYGIRSLDEAINFLSLGVVTSNPWQTADIGARGVLLPNDNGKHFLLLVDGHAINDPLYGAARFDAGAGFPLDLVDRIEVIVGPGSVLYGSSAMLGVINVITKSGRVYRGGHALAEYELERAVRGGAGMGLTFELFGKPSEVTAAVEHQSRFGPDLEFRRRQYPPDLLSGRPASYRRGEPADGVWGGTVRDAYFSEATSALVRFRLDTFEISLMGSIYRRGIPFTRPAQSVFFDDADSFERDRALRLDVKHQATLSSLLQLSSRVYADSFDYTRRINAPAEGECFQSYFETCQFYDVGLARWAGIEERLSFNWARDSSLVTLLGIDGRMRWVSAKTDPIDADTGRLFAPSTGRVDDSAAILSPYVQQTYSPTHWLDLNAGLRLDADARFSPIASPRGAVTVTPFRKTAVKAIYSQAFRAPTWFETDANTYRQARAPDLEPEIVRSVEGSIEQRFATQRVFFGVFRTWWDNLVEPRALSLSDVSELQNRGELPLTARNIIQHRNVSRIDNYGYNGGWRGSLLDGRLTYGFNVTAAYTRRETPNGPEPLAVAPQLFGNANVAYAFGGYVPTPALAVSFVDERLADVDYMSSAQFSELPVASALAEFRATLSGKIPYVDELSYRLSGAYATASHGPYGAGPGLSSVDPDRRAILTPIDQYRVFLGLRYDFLTDGSEWGGGVQ